MFDRYLVTPRPEVHVHNNIEQKPHDPADAARLYGQLRDKAETEVANATVERLGANNELTVVRIESMYLAQTDEQVARVLFKLNGQMFDFEVTQDREALRDRAYRSVAETIAAEVMKHLTSPRLTR